MYHSIGDPEYGKYVVNGINDRDIQHIKGNIKHEGHFKVNNVLNIVIIPCASNSGGIKCLEQCLNILSNDPITNGLKVYYKVKNMNTKQIMIYFFAMFKEIKMFNP